MELVEASKIEGITCSEILANEVEMVMKLGEDMIYFCAEQGGVGLSAPQIGVNKKIFVWHIGDDMFQIVVNAWFIADGYKKTNTIEACLSYPDERYYLTRYKRIRGVYYTIQPDKTLLKIAKNFRGDEAIVFQHEAQHLQGKTIRTQGELIDDESSVVEG